VLFHLVCLSYLNFLKAIPNKSNYSHTMIENITLTYMFDLNLEFILPNVKWVSCGSIDVPCLECHELKILKLLVVLVK
jgi:hypothetical protein